MDAFPAFFPLQGARVVIAGAGEPADARARLFADSPAEVVRLDETWGLDPDAYQGARLIFIASHDEAFARRAEVAARTASAPVNVFDRPALSDFNTPAIVDRGTVVAAVGTTGSAPLLAQLLRTEIETRLPAGVSQIAALLGERRARIREAFPDLVERRNFLRAALAGAPTAESLDAAILAHRPAPARVALIDLPPAADLLSLRAVQALAAAEAVAAPPAGQPLLARHARRDAMRLDFGSLAAAPILDLVRAGRGVAIVAAPAALAAALGDKETDVLRAAPEAG